MAGLLSRSAYDYLRYSAFRIDRFRTSSVNNIVEWAKFTRLANVVCRRLIDLVPWYSTFCVDVLLSIPYSEVNVDRIRDYIQRNHHRIRTSLEVKLVMNQAIAISDVALAGEVYDSAVVRGITPPKKALRNLSLVRGDIGHVLRLARNSPKRNIVKAHYPDKYVAPDDVESVLFSNAKVAILTTLGPGDEVSISMTYGALIEDSRVRRENLKITCDFRLYETLKATYPEITFVPTRLTRHIDARHPYTDYNELPAYRVHRILCNDGARAIADCDRFLMNFDLLHTYSDTIRHGRLPRRLHVNASLAEKFRSRLPRDTRLVGVSWRSSISPIKRNANLLTIEQVSQLFDLDGVTFVNLQYDDSREEAAWAEKHFPGRMITLDDVDMYNDFESVIALMSCLDCVVSAPTSVYTIALKAGCRTVLTSNAIDMAREITPDGWDHDSVGDLVQISGDTLGDKDSLVRNLKTWLAAQRDSARAATA